MKRIYVMLLFALACAAYISAAIASPAYASLTPRFENQTDKIVMSGGFLTATTDGNIPLLDPDNPIAGIDTRFYSTSKGEIYFFRIGATNQYYTQFTPYDLFGQNVGSEQIGCQVGIELTGSGSGGGKFIGIKSLGKNTGCTTIVDDIIRNYEVRGFSTNSLVVSEVRSDNIDIPTCSPGNATCLQQRAAAIAQWEATVRASCGTGSQQQIDQCTRNLEIITCMKSDPGVTRDQCYDRKDAEDILADNFWMINAETTDEEIQRICSALTNNTQREECITKATAHRDTLAGAGEATTQCNIDGIGWIVCPVVRFLARIVDASYAFVSSMLRVESRLFTDRENGIYPAWAVMRNIANVLFVIAFLAIIYSQLTGAGINNYGVKKMLPKLIAGAVLVNTSYWLCAAAVDLSNVLGNSVYNILDGTSLYPDQVNQSIVAGSSGGGIWDALALTALVGVTGAGVATGVLSISIFLPIVLMAAFAVLTVAIVLTLRQALIVGLIIVAPVALVAWLLPNTEKFTKLWGGTLMPLLMMPLAVGVIFGGGSILNKILTAVSETMPGYQGFLMQVMAAAMAVIPLFLTWILMKTGGNILSKVTGVVNNKERGLIDRSKKMASDRQKYRWQATKAGYGRGGKKSNTSNRVARWTGASWRDRGRRSRQQDMDKFENAQKAAWMGTPGGAQALKSAQVAANTVATMEGKIKAEAEITNIKNDQALRTEAEVTKLELVAAQGGEKAGISELAATGKGALGAAAKRAREDAHVSEIAGAASERLITKANAMAVKTRRSGEAAGADDAFGAQRAIAYADQTLEKQLNENMLAERSTLGSVSDTDLATRSLKGIDDKGNVLSTEARMAAASEISRRGYHQNHIDLYRGLNKQMSDAAQVHYNAAASMPELDRSNFKTDDEHNAAVEAYVDTQLVNDESLDSLRYMQKQVMEDIGGNLPFGVGDEMRGAMGRGVSRMDFDKEWAKRLTKKLSAPAIQKFKSEDMKWIKEGFRSGKLGTEHATALQASVNDIMSSTDATADTKTEIKKFFDELKADGHITDSFDVP